MWVFWVWLCVLVFLIGVFLDIYNILLFFFKFICLLFFVFYFCFERGMRREVVVEMVFCWRRCYRLCLRFESCRGWCGRWVDVCIESVGFAWFFWGFWLFIGGFFLGFFCMYYRWGVLNCEYFLLVCNRVGISLVVG